jgi:hypothetical protein
MSSNNPDDKTTVPLVLLGELQQRLETLEQKVAQLGFNTKPVWDVLQEELSKLRSDFNSLTASNLNNTQKCLYCDNGVYNIVLDTRISSPHDIPNQLQRYGVNYRPTEVSKVWIVKVCNWCGNTQYFNLMLQSLAAWEK